MPSTITNTEESLFSVIKLDDSGEVGQFGNFAPVELDCPLPTINWGEEGVAQQKGFHTSGRLIDSMRLLLLLSLLLAGASCSPLIQHDLRAVCDVITEFGAAGDNRTEDTAAVTHALLSCSKVVLRAGRTFLLRPIQLHSHRHLVVDGNIAAWREVGTWPNSSHNLCATTGYLTPPNEAVLVPTKEALLWGVGPLLNLTTSGKGTVDGQGWRWWPLKNDTTHGEYWHNCRPKLVSLGQMNITRYGSVAAQTRARAGGARGLGGARGDGTPYLYRGAGQVVHSYVSLCAHYA